MVRKKILLSGFGLLSVLVVVWLLIHSGRPEAIPIGSVMPELQFITREGEQKLQPDKSAKTIVMYFHRNCKYCTYELQQFEQHLQEFAAVKLIFLTAERTFFESGAIEKWPSIAKTPGVIWGIVDRIQLKHAFGVSVIPSLFIFDQNGYLFHKFHGEVRIRKVLKVLKMR